MCVRVQMASGGGGSAGAMDGPVDVTEDCAGDCECGGGGSAGPAGAMGASAKGGDSDWTSRDFKRARLDGEGHEHQPDGGPTGSPGHDTGASESATRRRPDKVLPLSLPVPSFPAPPGLMQWLITGSWDHDGVRRLWCVTLSG
jgi:hypothetical protein